MTITKLSTPGVYVDEIKTLPPSVAEVETAIPAFIGYTEKADHLKPGDLINIPTKIASINEYQLYFGNPPTETDDSIEIVITDDGNLNYAVTVTIKADKLSKNNMAYAIRHYFDNGGGSCYIVSVGGYNDAIEKGDVALKKGLLYGLENVKEIDEVTLLVVPEAPVSDNYDSVVQAMIKQSADPSLRDRFAIIDPKQVTPQDHENPLGKIEEDVKAIRDGATAGDQYDYNYAAAYYPNLVTTYGLNYYADLTTSQLLDLTIEKYNFTGQDPDSNPKNLKLSTKKLSNIPGSTSSALYGKIKAAINKAYVTLPPSPAIAGLYARVDSTKGVWKAPANEGLLNVTLPKVSISDRQQQNLNIDPDTGKSVNAIRTFPGKGTLVWGARTLNGNDNEWRYISVRRFFNMVEESVKKSSQRFVFAPNTIDTWVKVQAMINNYLFLKWKEGALAGVKPEQAYYVKVGLGSTMNSLDILEGRMNVEIGMAVVRPAEFIILKFSQMVQQS